MREEFSGVNRVDTAKVRGSWAGLFFVAILTVLVTAACGGAEPTPTPSPTAPPVPTATATPTASPTPTAGPTLPVSKVKEIQARGKLIVAVRQERSPSGVFKDPAHSRTRGLEVALAKAIAKKLLGDENKVELRSGPAKDVVTTVVQGNADLGLDTIFHAPTTDALKQQVEVSEPYAVGGVTLITRSGTGPGTVKELDGKSVASIDVGRDYRPDFDAFAKQRGLTITVTQFASYEEAAAAMESGQVQAMLGHTIAHTVYGAQNPGKFVFFGKPLTSEQFAVIAQKGNTELIAVVNEALRELKASGDLRRLAESLQFPPDSLALP
ncbi:MAG: amino acid ABC transporter substrate-binding protein [Chloroflexi bacterium]|nr:amino acid ABC transporter substrate-binding protein [Chloroflexota bacterium]